MNSIGFLLLTIELLLVVIMFLLAVKYQKNRQSALDSILEHSLGVIVVSVIHLIILAIGAWIMFVIFVWLAPKIGVVLTIFILAGFVLSPSLLVIPVNLWSHYKPQYERFFTWLGCCIVAIIFIFFLLFITLAGIALWNRSH